MAISRVCPEFCTQSGFKTCWEAEAMSLGQGTEAEGG